MAHKLLLADDSVTIQRVIELTFADEDINVIAVGDGKQAIERVQSERPDIVLADVGMPERDGYEVAAFIKGNPQLAHIPVLLLTGAFEPVDEGRARAAGCDGVLVKPFEPQMVINRVKDLLAGRKPAAAWAATPAPPPQPPVRPAAPAQPAADPDLVRTQAGPPPAQPPADSLDDYFDRLDAAFATLGGTETPAGAPATPGTPAASPSVPSARAKDPAEWDPELTGDPARPAPFAPPTPPVQPPVSRPAPSAATQPAPPIGRASSAPIPVVQAAQPAPAAAGPSLAEAFAALLTAEQGQPIAPPPAAAAVPVPDSMVEEVVRRVIDRMTDQAVHQTVLDVAERLVREEIERIKNR